MEFLTKLLGVWFGVFARMSVPFWRKLFQGKNLKFNFQYLKRTLASFVLSTIFTILLFPKLEFSPQGALNLESGFKLFCLTFAFGFGVNAIIIEFSQWFEKKEV